MKKAHHRPVTALATALFLGAPGVLPAETVVIAEESQGFQSFQDYSVNPSGTVVFQAVKSDGDGNFTGVFKGSGSGVTTMARKSPIGGGYAFLFQSTDVNGNGDVAFSAGVQRGQFCESATYAGPDAVNDLKVGFGGCGPFDRPRAFLNDQRYYAFSQTGGTSLIFDDPDRRRDVFFARECLAFNNRNEMLYRDGPSLKRIAFGPFKNDVPPTFDISTVATVPPPATIGDVAMNNNGTVVFVRVNGTHRQVVRGSEVIVEFDNNVPEAGEFSLLSDTRIGIDDDGRVYFSAFSKTLGKFGIFKGTNPREDKIVAEGDVFDGIAIGPLVMPASPTNLNVAGPGKVAFIAHTTQGIGLYLTTGTSSPPPPPPSSTVIRWVGPAVPQPVPPPNGDSFGLSAHWEPPRVPEKSETRSDIAVFDLSAVYAVDVGTQTSERLLVRDAQVTFSMNDYKVGALSFDDPSVVVNNALLRLVSGKLKSIHALIGESAAARVDLEPAWWENTGSLRVGGAGEGILNLGLGGVVISGEARIGTGAGGGKAFVTSELSLWKTGNIAIGAGGLGELTVENGGQVESGIAKVSEAGIPTSGSVVLVTGVNALSNTRSKWKVTERLGIGAGTTGTVRIHDGGLLSVTGPLDLGSRPEEPPGATGATGVIEVLGTNATKTGVPSQVEVNGKLVVGGKEGKAEGILTIAEGASFKVSGEAIIGAGAFGEVSVRGSSATGLRSTFEVTTSLDVGLNDGSGCLIVEDGGDLMVGTLRLASFDQGISGGAATGFVHLHGFDAKSERASKLFVDGELQVGKGGTDAVVIVENGAEAVVSLGAGIGLLSEGRLELRGVHAESGNRAGMLIFGGLLVGLDGEGTGVRIWGQS